jgi:hypothetical protein
MGERPTIGGTDNVGEIRSSVDPLPAGHTVGIQTQQSARTYPPGAPAGFPREHLWLWPKFTPYGQQWFWNLAVARGPEYIGKLVAVIVRRHDERRAVDAAANGGG